MHTLPVLFCRLTLCFHPLSWSCSTAQTWALESQKKDAHRARWQQIEMCPATDKTREQRWDPPQAVVVFEHCLWAKQKQNGSPSSWWFSFCFQMVKQPWLPAVFEFSQAESTDFFLLYSGPSGPSRVQNKAAMAKRDYLVEAAKQIRMALDSEVNEDYEAAFSYYKNGVDLLLNGVQCKQKISGLLQKYSSLIVLWMENLKRSIVEDMWHRQK